MLRKEDFEFGNPLTAYQNEPDAYRIEDLKDEKAYRSAKILGATDCKNLALCPQEFILRRVLEHSGRLPVWLEEKTSDAMLFGTAFHLAVLQPNEYLERVRVINEYYPSFVYKEAKEAKERAIKDAGPDGILLRCQDGWALERMIEALDRRKLTDSLRACDVELPLVAYVDVLGDPMWFKGKLDAYDRNSGIIYDLKTTTSFDAWEEYAEKYFTYVQAYHYAMLIKANKLEFNSFIFVICESVFPFRVKTVKCNPYTRQFEVASNQWIEGIRYFNRARKAKTLEEFMNVV